MVFNAVFNVISNISWRPDYLPQSTFNQYSAQHSVEATGYLTVVEKVDSGEGGMNPVTMTCQSSETILANRRFETATSCLFSSPARYRVSYGGSVQLHLNDGHT